MRLRSSRQGNTPGWLSVEMCGLSFRIVGHSPARATWYWRSHMVSYWVSEGWVGGGPASYGYHFLLYSGKFVVRG